MGGIHKHKFFSFNNSFYFINPFIGTQGNLLHSKSILIQYDKRIGEDRYPGRVEGVGDIE